MPENQTIAPASATLTADATPSRFVAQAGLAAVVAILVGCFALLASV